MSSALSCPSCGAEQAAVPTELLVRCVACAASSVVTGLDFIPQRLVQPTVDAKHAHRAARHWMRGWRMRELLSLRAKYAEPKLLLLPFARLEADAVGWIFARSPADDKGEVKKHYEIELAQRFDDTVMLADSGAIGIGHIPSLLGVATVPFEASAAAKLGEVVPITATGDPAAQSIRERWRNRPFDHEDVGVVTGKAVTFIDSGPGRGESIVYYPFWRIEYRYGNSDFTVFVDGRTGAIASGRAPGSFLFGALAFAVLMPLGASVTTGGLQWGWSLIRAPGHRHNDHSGVGFLICLLALAAGGIFAMFAYNNLRFAGEIEGGYAIEPTSEQESESEPDKNKGSRS